MEDKGKKEENIWPQIRAKIVLLAIGAVATGLTMFSTLFFSQFMLRADYDKDEITRAKLFTEIQQGFVRGEQQLEAMNQKMDRMNTKIDRLDDKLERSRK